MRPELSSARFAGGVCPHEPSEDIAVQAPSGACIDHYDVDPFHSWVVLLGDCYPESFLRPPAFISVVTRATVSVNCARHTNLHASASRRGIRRRCRRSNQWLRLLKY